MFDNYDIFDRKKTRLHCVITTQSPLSHIGTVTGNVSNLKTLERIDINGDRRSVFAYSGNALRNGVIRRRGVSKALEVLGLEVNPDVHHTLFAGGRIDGSTGSDMELDAQIRKLMPWLSVLGTAKPAKVFGTKDAQMVQGRLNVGSAYLVCFESCDYVYEQFPGLIHPDAIEGIQAILRAKADLTEDPFNVPDKGSIAAYREAKQNYIPLLRKVMKSWTEYVMVDQTTRRDSTHDTELQKFLPAKEQELLAGDGEAKKKEKSDQMIASDRLIVPGAKLYSRWDVNCTDVELGFIVDALLAFSESPYIAGKGNRGNGLVSMQFWFEQGIDRGEFMVLGKGVNTLSPTANAAHAKYSEYLSVWSDYLSQAKESQELRGLLSA